MRADADRLREVVGGVPDPEIGRSLGELGMLDDVRVDRRGHARVSVALTTSGCPLADALRESVVDAATRVDGVRTVEVAFTVMDERRRAGVGRRLHETRTPLGGALGGGPRVYAVASGKGGVGKSTVTANLAVALAASGQRVGVLDADVWGYSMPQLFGVRRAPIAFDGVMLPVPAHGVALMSIGFFVTDEQPVAWRGPMLHKALEQFCADVYWGELDVLLVDLPPGTGDVTLSVLQLLPEASLVVVTTPQRAASTVASRVGRLARDAGMPVAGVVENMSGPVFGSGGGAALAAELDTSLLGELPLTPEVRETGDRGVPVVLATPDDPASAEFRRMADSLPAPRRALVRRPLPLHVS